MTRYSAVAACRIPLRLRVFCVRSSAVCCFVRSLLLRVCYSSRLRPNPAYYCNLLGIPEALLVGA